MHASVSYRRQGLLIALVVAVILGGGMLAFELQSHPGAGPALKDGKLNEAQAESTKVMLDLFQLLMTWALAIIGATGFFLKLQSTSSMIKS